MGTYVYGVVRAPVQAGDLSVRGVGGGKLDAIEVDGLAAVVTDVDGSELRVSRKDLLAHAGVLQELAVRRDVLPMRFGMVVKDVDALVEFVRENHSPLTQMLDAVEGCVELQLKADYDEELVLAEIVKSDKRVAALSAATGSSSPSYPKQLALGEAVAGALDRARDRDARALVDRLARRAENVAVGELHSEHAVANVAFLVGRKNLDEFDRAVAEASDAVAPRISLRLVGPLAPHSFVDAAAVAR